MQARTLRCLVAAIAVVTCLATAADEDVSPACELPVSATDPLVDRAGMLARYEQLPHACLREIVSACTVAASQALLDLGSAAACSFGYEALLKEGFGGNFGALLAWWRSQRTRTLP